MDHGAEPTRVKKYCWVTLTGFGTVKKILKELPTVNCKAKNWDKDRSCFFFGAVEEKKKFRIESGFAPLFAWDQAPQWRNFQLARFFFSLTACAGIFFSWTPLHEFFFRQILLFFEQWNLDSLSMFLCFVYYSTLTTDQRIQATWMHNLFENVHTVREEEATWSGWLPCHFFQSLPSQIPLPQPIIMMPYSIHQNSPSVVPSTPMSIQKEGTCLVKVKY